MSEQHAPKAAASDSRMSQTPAEELTIAFIGNPNCGKTTLFNAYTGANLKVANWPGVTVERVEGAIESHGRKIRLVDLPGTYSLSSYTMEEQVSLQFILSDQVDVVVDVADASSLERSLYLTLQLIELGKPVVLALNMMDIVEKRGIDLDLHRLQELLGIPVVPVVARKKKGLRTLLHAALHQHEDGDASNHRPGRWTGKRNWSMSRNTQQTLKRTSGIWSRSCPLIQPIPGTLLWDFWNTILSS